MGMLSGNKGIQGDGESVHAAKPGTRAAERVLIVEDDAAMLRGLRDNFAYEGYEVVCANDGEMGLKRALEVRPALIVLDIMLPKINGYEVCRLLRKEGLEIPIIMLTAKGQEQDVVLGLNLGADDYVTKPFGVKELLARARAFLRRAHAGNGKAAPFRFGDFELNRAARTLSQDGKRVTLTPKEYAVLELLTRRIGRALTRDEILRQAWGYNVFVTGRSVDRCINTLRAKMEEDPARPRWIQTVREIGYRFEA
jgi:DNA-binding response OmpR family regulator